MKLWNGLSATGILAQGATGEVIDEAQDLLAEFTVIKLLQTLVVVAIAYAILFTIEKILNWLSERVYRQYRLSIKQSLPFWQGLIFLITVAILSNLLLNLSPNNVLAVTGTAAVALGFAFKDYVSSIIAGFIALFERPYQVGDRVRISKYYGEVIAYGLRGIRLRTPSDDVVTIPHNVIWTEPVANANKGKLEAQVVTDFFLDHTADMERVVKILYRVAYTSKYTQLQLPVQVILAEKPWGTHASLKAYPIDARDEFVYKTDLTRRAKGLFAKYAIPYPRTMAFFAMADALESEEASP